MATRTTQPYRASGARQQTPALRAMTRGKPALMQNPAQARNQAMRKHKRRRRHRGRRRHPTPLHKMLGIRNRIGY
jgi:hypothetical protein